MRAEDDADDWFSQPEIEHRPYSGMPGYFQESNNPILQHYQQLEQRDQQEQNGAPAPPAAKDTSGGGSALPTGSPGITPEGKKGWFSRKPKQPNPKKMKPLSDAQITRVGPRDPAPFTNPLLALPVALRNASGQRVPAGFYLVQQQSATADSKDLLLLREGRAVFSFQVHRRQDAPADEGGASPLSPMPGAPPAGPVIKAVVSPVNANSPQTAILTLEAEGQHYQSDPLAVDSDPRPALR